MLYARKHAMTSPLRLLTQQLGTVSFQSSLGSGGLVRVAIDRTNNVFAVHGTYTVHRIDKTNYNAVDRSFQLSTNSNQFIYGSEIINGPLLGNIVASRTQDRIFIRGGNYVNAGGSWSGGALYGLDSSYTGSYTTGSTNNPIMLYRALPVTAGGLNITADGKTLIWVLENFSPSVTAYGNLNTLQNKDFYSADGNGVRYSYHSTNGSSGYPKTSVATPDKTKLVTTEYWDGRLVIANGAPGATPTTQDMWDQYGTQYDNSATNYTEGMVMHPSGAYVVLINRAWGYMSVYDLTTFSLKTRYFGANFPISQAANCGGFSPDGSFFYVGDGANNQVLVFSTTTWLTQQVSSWDQERTTSAVRGLVAKIPVPHDIGGLAVSFDGTIMAVGSATGTARATMYGLGYGQGVL